MSAGSTVSGAPKSLSCRQPRPACAFSICPWASLQPNEGASTRLKYLSEGIRTRFPSSYVRDDIMYYCEPRLQYPVRVEKPNPHFLSAGLAATPENSNGVPFNCSHIYTSGNIAGDMLANVTAEATGRTLACRLYDMTDGPGMKDMLSFLIARDTMHQQQWLAVIEELGGFTDQLPVPNSFPQSEENQTSSYAYFTSQADGSVPPTLSDARFATGASLDGKGQFSIFPNRPLGEEPQLAPGPKSAYAQKEQHLGLLDKLKRTVTG